MDQNITASPTPPAAPPSAAPPTEPAITPRRWTAGLVFVAFLIAVLAFLLGSFRAVNTDVWMHLAAGKLLAAGQYQFGVDPFSWASEGAYWTNQSWLSSLLAYEIYVHFGGETLVAVKALIVVGLAGFLFASRLDDSPLLPALELTALAILVASPRFFLHPAMLSFAGLAMLTWLLTRNGYLGGVGEAKPKPLWQIPLLFLVWSNFDAYFVLGLLTLALVAIGLTCVAATRRDARRLAIVLGLSFVASIANPHFLRNFTMPIDLASLLGWLIPGDTTAAGRAVEPFILAGDSTYVNVSPFSSRGILLFNYTVTGMCFYLLVLLNLISFVACAFVPGARAFVPRLLVCLVFVALAGFQHRLAAFYAIVAGPMTVQNFTDYVRWGWRQKSMSPGASRFATLLTTLALLVAIFLVWPGLLHVPLNQYSEDAMQRSPWRVDWDCSPIPTLHRTALALQDEARTERSNEGRKDAKDAKDRVLKVFNLSPEIAHYTAYFAPDVKCGVDNRMSLFAAIAGDYAQTRRDLLEDPRQIAPRKDAVNLPPPWWTTFEKWRVDTVVVWNYFGTAPRSTAILGDAIVYGPRHWKPIVADGQTLAALWAGKEAWKENYLHAKWRREAFGPSPQIAWLPWDRSIIPPVEPAWLNEYLWGVGSTPLEASTARFQLLFHQNESLAWVKPYVLANYVAAPAVFGNAVATPSWLFTAQGIGTANAIDRAAGFEKGQINAIKKAVWENQLSHRFIHDHDVVSKSQTLFQPKDFATPSLPILARRNIRRALDENPALAGTFHLLSESTRQALRQEAYWAGDHAPTLRHQLRHVEMVTALRNATVLAPDNVEYHLQLADYLNDNVCLDAALVEHRAAVKLLDEAPATASSFQRLLPIDFRDVRLNPARPGAEKPGQVSDPIVAGFETMRTNHRRKLTQKEDVVRKRTENFLLQAGHLGPAERFTHAVLLPYRASNQDRYDMRGRGLVLEGLKALESAKTSDWTPPQKSERWYLLIRYNCFQGKIAEALAFFAAGKDELSPEHQLECLLWVGAGTGTYEQLDTSLGFMESQAAKTLKKLRDDRVHDSDVLRLFTLAQLFDEPGLAGTCHEFAAKKHVLDSANALRSLKMDLGELRTLRGIYALERGDVEKALGLFDSALAENVPFHDREIARRYRELIRAEKK